VVLVSSYQPVIERSKLLGWEVLVEESQHSESSSVDWASRELEERGCGLVMRLPADVPLVRASDIDLLLAEEVRAPGAILVPSRDGTGTNAVVRTPPTLFPSRFGPNSFALHRAEVDRIGAQCRVIVNDRIALDIDEPADLDLLVELGAGTEAGRVASGFRDEWRLQSQA
jgi:2-phospho-L-lactate guanylyltransferase